MVAARAKFVEDLPAGAMLAVALDEHALAELVAVLAGVVVAAVNAPRLCVVAGEEEAVAAFERELSGAGVGQQRLRASHACKRRCGFSVRAKRSSQDASSSLTRAAKRI